jgi:hypothetical protein
MKALLLISLLALLVEAKEACGPDGIVCSYERMYEQFEERRAVYPGPEKIVLRTLLREHFTGSLLSGALKYLENTEMASSEAIHLFLEPQEKVLSSREEKVNETTYWVYREVLQKQPVMSKEGPMSQVVLYRYTVVKDFNTWKISEVKVEGGNLSPLKHAQEVIRGSMDSQLPTSLQGIQDRILYLPQV